MTDTADVVRIETKMEKKNAKKSDQIARKGSKSPRKGNPSKDDPTSAREQKKRNQS